MPPEETTQERPESPSARFFDTQGKNGFQNHQGLDSPLFKYNLYRFAESRGVGRQNYYVVGWDNLTQTPLASIMGHLGRIDNRQFLELTVDQNKILTAHFNGGQEVW